MKLFDLKIIAFIALAFGMPMTSFALEAGQILENINDQIPYFFQAASALCYVIGIFFLIRGLFKLKEYGEAHGKSAGQHMTLAGPMAFIVIGAMMLYLPSTKDALLTTVYGTTTLGSYTGYTNVPASSDKLLEVIVNIVRFVGFISFIRALLLLHKVGNNQGQQGTFGKGVTHAVGGVIAMNIVTFIDIIGKTIGIQ